MTAPQGARQTAVCISAPFAFPARRDARVSARRVETPKRAFRQTEGCRSPPCPALPTCPFWCLPCVPTEGKGALTGCLRQPCAAGGTPAPLTGHPLTVHKWKPGQGWRGWLARPAAQRGHGPPPESTAALDAVGTPQPQPGSRRRAQPAPCSRGQSGKIGRGGPARRGLVKPEGREGGVWTPKGQERGRKAPGRPLGAPRRRFQGWGSG